MTIVILALCAGGLWAAVSMQAKAMRAQRGELAEASVVQTSRARLFGGAPNSLFGIVYYIALACAAPFVHVAIVRSAMLVAACFAGAVSVYLAYSLLLLTRMPCVRCWTGHFVNWLLVLVLAIGR